MEQDEMARSEGRVRVLAEAVGLPLVAGEVAGLALAFDAAMEMVRELGEIADAGGVPVAGGYDAAWPQEGRR